ncbi:hypothetical protein TRFO_18069 [Tritrichomonas foetus]|uniref:Protein kinase domain-containing protein n=1 Tax=Tritrichomonas foetus TaxID=1144522 RepID=A0A1J4KLT2_9EUKA|nr:hypothetical protein TRFO_18069 [Tritrichomonas foetus]|eukprot:OHT12257.1 hypothetical protein TRFO_18069 [Tritrichomonas foetus]
MGNQIVCPSGQNWYLNDFEALNYKIVDSLFDGTFSLSFKARFLPSHKLVAIKAYKILNKQMKDIVDIFFDIFKAMHAISPDLVYGNLFSIPLKSPESAYLVRQFIEHPLPERIVSYPLLHPFEKKWIAFQILKAVSNLRENGIFHGDIKPENIFVNDSLFVQIVDHSPFKPEVIGSNQPHYFIHFFSYARGYCFLAPERIKQKNYDITNTDLSTIKNCSPNQNQNENNNVNKNMKEDDNKSLLNINNYAADVFSAACVVAYLFLNGQYLFDFSTIQEYANADENLHNNENLDIFQKDVINTKEKSRQNEIYNNNISSGIFLDEKLKTIEDKEMIDLLKSLLVVNPEKRMEHFDNFEKYFPSWFPDLYEAYKGTLFGITEGAILGLVPQILEIIPKTEKDAFIICLSSISEAFFQENSIHSLIYLTKSFIDVALNYIEDSNIQLTRVIPHLIGLFDLNCTTINIYALDGIISIIKSIQIISDDFSNYASFYLLPHLKSTMKGNWALQFLAKLPFLIESCSKLWPDFLFDIHKKSLIQYFVPDQITMHPFIYSAASVARINSNYKIFSCLNVYMKEIMTLGYHIIPLIEFYSQFIYYFNNSDILLFFNHDFPELLKNLVIHIDTNNEYGSSIILFLKNILSNPKLSKYLLPSISLFAKTAISYQCHYDERIRCTCLQIIKMLPLQYHIFSSAAWFKKTIEMPDRHTKSNIVQRRQGSLRNPGKSMLSKSDEYAKSKFLVSQKLFDGPVNNIFMNYGDKIIMQHDNSVLSVIEFDSALTPKFAEVNKTEFTEGIDFITEITKSEIIVTTNSHAYIISNNKERVSFGIPTKFGFQTDYYDDKYILTSPVNSTIVEIRNIESFKIASTINLGKNIPCSMSAWKDKPLIAFGTQIKHLHMLDSRIGVPIVSHKLFSDNFSQNKISQTVIPFDNDHRYCVVTNHSLEFYDLRFPGNPYFFVLGNNDCVINYYNNILINGSNGTFLVDANDNQTVKSLIDNSYGFKLKRNQFKNYYNDDTLPCYTLPNEYQRSIHSHLFPVISADYNKTTGICCTGDTNGFVHLWLPSAVKCL